MPGFGKTGSIPPMGKRLRFRDLKDRGIVNNRVIPTPVDYILAR
jgi:hypothetical protein